MKRASLVSLLVLFGLGLGFYARHVRAQTGANLNLALTWSDGSKVRGTVALDYYDSAGTLHTVCAATFSPSGRAGCNVPVLPDTFYSAVLSAVNPSNGQPATINVGFFVPSWIMPSPLTAASYSSVLDVATNQSVPGSTTITVTY